MTPSILRILPWCMCCVLLTGCVGASNWLAGPTQFQNSLLDPSHRLAPIQIGVTTKQEIVTNFGNPTDRQIHSIDGTQFESLSYSTTEIAINPFQYIPLFGAAASWRSTSSRTPSAAFSFSSEEKVSGLTVSTVNAYGDTRSPKRFLIPNSPISFYGMRNPEVFHITVNSP